MRWPGSVTVIPVAISLVLLGFLALFLRWPPLKDVTTTPDDPPRFHVDPPGDVGYPERFAGLQRRAYPDLAPLRMRAAPAATYQRVRAVAGEMPGWTVVFESDSLAALQAVASTRFLNFKDDVVVEVRPADGGSAVHVRSRSRIGRTDFGANARRIRDFLARLQ